MKYSLLAILCVFSLTIKAQVDEVDSELWLSSTYKLELNKKWRFEIEDQLRLEEHIGTFGSNVIETGVRYTILRDLDIKGQYRYTIVDQGLASDFIEKSAFNESRFSLDLSYELDKKNFPLSLYYRARFQDGKARYTGEKKTMLRNRLGLELELGKNISPFVEYENFFRLNDKNEFRENRYTAGIEWRINKEMDLSTFYRIDQQMNTRSNKQQNIVGIAFSYTQKLKKKRIKNPFAEGLLVP